jgi:inorganic triphosphatase YgiF
VELERKGGELAAMFTLAREIEAQVPARLCVLSKAERGYRLLGPAAPAVKAGRVHLTPEMTVADSFSAIVSACLGHFHRNVPAVLDCSDARALHQARVTIRRLRSALSLYRPVLQDPRTLTRFKRELQWLAGKLAATREIDVLIESAAASSGAEALLVPLTAARTKAATAAATALRSKRCRALMLDLGEWIAVGRWRSAPGNAERRGEPACDFAARVLAHRRKVLRKRARHLAGLDDEGRHEARKAAKKLRYTADFFAALYPQEREDRRRKRFVKRVERLQERLGSLNDLATAPAAMARLGLAELPQSKRSADNHERTRMIRAATKDFGDFDTAKPFWN